MSQLLNLFIYAHIQFIYVLIFYLHATININLVFVITVMTYSVPILFGCMHFIPNLLDLVAPLNQSRPRHLLIVAEYFVDNDEYFYHILVYIVMSTFIIQTALMSTTSIYVAFIQHACGMFEIAR